MEYLSQFDFDICYVKGETNKVADTLSWYFESDTWEDATSPEEFVNADVCLNPEFDRSGGRSENAISGRNNRKVISNEHLSALKEGVEERDLLAAELAANTEPNPEPTTTSDEEDLIVFHS